LQPAEARLEENSMAEAAGIALAGREPEYLHFSRRQDVVVWAPRRLRGKSSASNSSATIYEK
jgi:hypothetical protein